MIGGSRIPFARAHGAYSGVGNQEMMTAALRGLVERHGLPIGVKELDPVTGWPYSQASLPLKDNVAEYTATQVERIACGLHQLGDRKSVV